MSAVLAGTALLLSGAAVGTTQAVAAPAAATATFYSDYDFTGGTEIINATENDGGGVHVHYGSWHSVRNNTGRVLCPRDSAGKDWELSGNYSRNHIGDPNPIVDAHVRPSWSGKC
ncbi:hypothetical protein OG206_00425 [Streptomyces sp. NBC_01341]|uniref:hypothetical protein n=1 Tax=Streptomyces sp. NBC_01341 TaxID=2903831 RepID=UPI002E12F8CA|nr:hypothetical protein OG206_00425 [Streptomyces sp. NBC_01341]